jgi:hypothetical protein
VELIENSAPGDEPGAVGRFIKGLRQPAPAQTR